MCLAFIECREGNKKPHWRWKLILNKLFHPGITTKMTDNATKVIQYTHEQWQNVACGIYHSVVIDFIMKNEQLSILYANKQVYQHNCLFFHFCQPPQSISFFFYFIQYCLWTDPKDLYLMYEAYLSGMHWGKLIPLCILWLGFVLFNSGKKRRAFYLL